MRFDHTRLRYQFPGSEYLTRNYSQSGQDLFVLSMLRGRRDGTYLEIGSAHGEELSNTALLEREFGWRGAGVDISPEFVAGYNALRQNKTTVADATTADFHEILQSLAGIESRTLDYLSCDCEPAEQTLRALRNVLSQGFKFAVITFEHDSYTNGGITKQPSRDYLTDLGYELVVSNISALGQSYDYEDWWVHPELVDAEVIAAFKRNDDSIKDWAAYTYAC